MILTHKVEIFPTKEQVSEIEKLFTLRRAIFNKGLELLKKDFNLKVIMQSKKPLTSTSILKYRTKITQEAPDIVKLAGTNILHSTVVDLARSVETLKNPKVKDISFRSKKKGHNSFTFGRSNVNKDTGYSSLMYSFKLLKVPKIGKIKMSEELRWEWKPETIREVNISKKAGRYFANIVCLVDDYKPYEKQYTHTGIDWGLRTYLTCFDGKNILELDYIGKEKLLYLDRRIRLQQRKLSRMVRGSNNFYKARTKLERFRFRLENLQNNFIHDLVYIMDENYDSITLEDLNMSFIYSKEIESKLPRKVRKHNRVLAKRKPFYKIKIALINRFKNRGKQIFLLNQKELPTTKTCSCCGAKNDIKGSKIYKCVNCNLIIDRDVNAAKNLYSARIGLKEV